MTAIRERKDRAHEYSYRADCTLYLEEGRLIRKAIEGTWYSTHPLNDVECEVQSKHALSWVVGTLHHHDPKVTSRVTKHTVHSFTYREKARQETRRAE